MPPPITRIPLACASACHALAAACCPSAHPAPCRSCCPTLLPLRVPQLLLPHLSSTVAADDWRWFNKGVPAKLRELHSDGYQIVIFRYQGIRTAGLQT